MNARARLCLGACAAALALAALRGAPMAEADTVSLTVTKEWDDAANAYGTRPAPDGGTDTWEASFLVQRSADGGASWQDVDEGGAPMTVTLSGTDKESTAETVVTGLPAQADGAPCIYRARELAPGGGAVEEGGTYDTAYTVSYQDGENATTVTNTARITTVTARKSWVGVEPQAVRLLLQYPDEAGVWQTLRAVELDGEADGGESPWREESPWLAVWESVPAALPGSALEDGATPYRVAEETPPGCAAVIGHDGGAWTVANVEAVDVPAAKIWRGGEEHPDSVVLELYADGSPTGETVTLTAADADGDGVWRGVFAGLPAADASGGRILYDVREPNVPPGYEAVYEDGAIVNVRVPESSSVPAPPSESAPEMPSSAHTPDAANAARVPQTGDAAFPAVCAACALAAAAALVRGLHRPARPPGAHGK